MTAPAKLYHFTSKHHIEGCRADGLTLGGLPLSIEPPSIAPGFQWLTTNPDKQQSWNGRLTVKYDRTAFRITVRVPPARRNRLLKWTEGGPELVGPEAYEMLSAFGDPGNWWLYTGKIPPEWFLAVEDMRELEARAS